MTSDQYTELVGYLGRKFDGIDRKFEGVDQGIEESRRHATVLFEQSQANLQAVGEGLGLRIDRVQEAVGDLNGTVCDGFADHERRIRVLEGAESEGSTGG